MTDTAHEFIAKLKKARPIVGLDLGSKTIGVALSDRLWTIATPSHTISKKKFGKDAEALWQFLSEQEVCGIVLGLPSNMDGTAGARVQSTKSFAYNLSALWQDKMPPLLFWDERLSTVEAENAMISADLSRAKRATRIDSVAASLILQGALDRIRVITDG